jgi:hypothetical protein
MSKKIAVLCVLLTATIAMAIVPVSMRMRGLNPGLVGIVDDEYSDLFFNPAFINHIDGNRVYTNLSNIHNYGQDMIFDPDYAPDLYYNLLGGVTSCHNMKVGGILETGGYNSVMTDNEYTTDITGNSTYVDSTTDVTVDKNLSTAFDLFLGKRISNYDVGLFIAPQGVNYEQSEKTSDNTYYYVNDTLNEFDHSSEDVISSEKKFMVPVMVGMITGEPSNEYSAALSFAFDRGNSVLPVDILTSDVTDEIQNILQSHNESFEKMQQKEKLTGSYFNLNGRNKRRYEDHSFSFLGSISYAHEPITESAIDSVYDISMPMSGEKTEYTAFATQTAKGSMNYLDIALGVGAEKHFDAMNTENMFAIGVIPSFFTGAEKLTVSPIDTNVIFWSNNISRDTFAYTMFGTNGEFYNIKECFSGLGISVPMGLETHITDKLVLRLGATEDFMLKTKDHYEVSLADSGWKNVYTQTEPFDTIITNQEPSGELDSYTGISENKTSFANSTSYYYGLGYKISDNIELNFINYAQLTDLRTWVLGVNIKF